MTIEVNDQRQTAFDELKIAFDEIHSTYKRKLFENATELRDALLHIRHHRDNCGVKNIFPRTLNEMKFFPVKFRMWLGVCWYYRNTLGEVGVPPEQRRIGNLVERALQEMEANKAAEGSASQAIATLCGQLEEQLKDDSFGLFDMHHAIGQMADYMRQHSDKNEAYPVPPAAHFWMAFLRRNDPAASEAQRRIGQLLEQLMPLVIAHRDIQQFYEQFSSRPDLLVHHQPQTYEQLNACPDPVDEDVPFF